MEVKLLEFIPNITAASDPSKLLGYAKVELNEKMVIYMLVLKSSKNVLFGKFPSVKIKLEYRPSFFWIDKDMEKEIWSKISDEVKKELYGYP